MTAWPFPGEPAALEPAMDDMPVDLPTMTPDGKRIVLLKIVRLASEAAVSLDAGMVQAVKEAAEEL